MVGMEGVADVCSKFHARGTAIILMACLVNLARWTTFQFDRGGACFGRRITLFLVRVGRRLERA